MSDQMLDVTVVKKECISLFIKYINLLQKGYQPNYSHILNMMCFINSYDKLDNLKTTTQYLLNNAKTCLRVR